MTSKRRIACRLQGEPLDARGNPARVALPPGDPRAGGDMLQQVARSLVQKSGQARLGNQEVLDRIDGKTLPAPPKG